MNLVNGKEGKEVVELLSGDGSKVRKAGEGDGNWAGEGGLLLPPPINKKRLGGRDFRNSIVSLRCLT
jgi:hypothetical protein